MFTTENLHHIRADEINFLANRLVPGGELLELGAGTGFQARELARRGHKITAIDLPNSSYSHNRVYPVVDYDGSIIPFPNASFDVVFSSHVLEHVADLALTLAETRRVLKPGGYAIHTMPNSAWRLWTTLAGPVDFLPFVAATVAGRVPGSSLRAARGPIANFARGTIARFAPLAHGEKGNAISELVTFSRRHWQNQFGQNGFTVVRSEPMNLFYTGWCVVGRHATIPVRRRLAKALGSASCLYEVRPTNS